MTSTDVAFSGSVPALYDRYLRPLLFEPYAQDMAARVKELQPGDILETAAGTGIVTEAMIGALPDARIVATDLNQGMLEVAAERISSASVSFRQADAQSLPFEDSGFDAVVCQFGAMFFPDRIGAYREARRVLRPGGHLLFNVWDSLDSNPVSRTLSEAVAGVFPEDPPSFFSRVPFGYHDRDRIAQDLSAAGLTLVTADTVVRNGRVASARDAAIGLCHGTPLRAEIEARDPSRLDAATDAATEALSRLLGDAAETQLSAHVFVAAA